MFKLYDGPYDGRLEEACLDVLRLPVPTPAPRLDALTSITVPLPFEQKLAHYKLCVFWYNERGYKFYLYMGHPLGGFEGRAREIVNQLYLEDQRADSVLEELRKDRDRLNRLQRAVIEHNGCDENGWPFEWRIRSSTRNVRQALDHA